MKGDMNMKFAEQNGKIEVMQYQLGAVITLITVIGGVVSYSEFSIGNHPGDRRFESKDFLTAMEHVFGPEEVFHV